MIGFYCLHIENDEEEKSNAKELINSDNKILTQSFFSPEVGSLKPIGMKCYLVSNGLDNKDFQNFIQEFSLTRRINMDDSLYYENCNQLVKEPVICDAEAISYSSFETCVDSKVSYVDEDKIV